MLLLLLRRSVMRDSRSGGSTRLRSASYQRNRGSTAAAIVAAPHHPLHSQQLHLQRSSLSIISPTSNNYWTASLPQHDADSSSNTNSLSSSPRRRRQHHHHPTIPQSSKARRHFSISRHPDPLIRHGNINTLDDDDDVGDLDVTLLDGSASAAAAGGGGSDSKLIGGRKVLTADDYEYLDDILNWGVADEDDEDGIGKKKKKNQGSAASAGDDYADIFGSLDEDLGLTTKRGDGDGEDQDTEIVAYHARQAQIKASLDSRTSGRLWSSSWNISDEDWMTDEEWEDIEDWKPTLATRKSLESVRVYEDNVTGRIGVPTLQSLSEMRLPISLPQHPGYGNPSVYASYRRRRITEKIRSSVVRAARDDVAKMVHPTISNEQRRHMVDELYECIVDRVRDAEPVLGKLPDFAKFVEVALEEVLITVRNRAMKLERDAMKKQNRTNGDDFKVEGGGEKKEGGEGGGDNKAKERASSKSVKSSSATVDEQKMFVNSVMEVLDEYEIPTPIFMDILAATRHLEGKQRNQIHTQDNDGDAGTGGSVAFDVSSQSSSPQHIPKFFASSDKNDVPNLLFPLTVHPKEGVGRMVEEWQLAANKETKRIMIRDAMRDIARAIVEATTPASSAETTAGGGGAARVFVAGKRGVGKTATLAGIVASARISGHIVVYHPDGDRLRKHGYYIEPCPHRVGLYNLPEIAKEFCAQLLKSHGEDVSTLPGVTRENMKEYFSDDQIRRLFRRAFATEVESGTVREEDVANMTELSLDKILTVGVGSSSLSSGCYSAVISNLMNQTVRPFTVVMDEYNCYYDHGHYFHMDYDDTVRMGVPLNRITIFKPFMDAMGLYPDEAGTEITKEVAVKSDEAMMKLGSIVVSTSESKAVRQSFTKALIECAQAQTSCGDDVVADKNASPPQRRHAIHIVDVQRYNTTEVQQILYNFEITGIGRLRFDRGDTALNPEEVEYLRLVSGGCGQQLLDSCMLPSK